MQRASGPDFMVITGSDSAQMYIHKDSLGFGGGSGLDTAYLSNDTLFLISGTDTITVEGFESGGGIDGVGITNRLARWNSDSTLISSQIFDDSTQVGVNMTSGMTGKMSVRSNTSASNVILSLLRNDNATTHRFYENSQLSFGTNPPIIAAASPTSYTIGNTERALLLKSSQTAAGTGFGILLRAESTKTHTSGHYRQAGIFSTFVPTSGTGQFSLLEVKGYIDQASGGTGVTRGIYIDPDYLDAVDFRAVDTDITDGRFLRSSGDIQSWHRGKFKIGVDSVAVRDIDVTGTARITGSVDTANVQRLWGANLQGDKRDLKIGDGLTVSGDTISASGETFTETFASIQLNGETYLWGTAETDVNWLTAGVEYEGDILPVVDSNYIRVTTEGYFEVYFGGSIESDSINCTSLTTFTLYKNTTYITTICMDSHFQNGTHRSLFGKFVLYCNAEDKLKIKYDNGSECGLDLKFPAFHVRRLKT